MGKLHYIKRLATIVEGDPKTPFSIATTPRCREGATPFPGNDIILYDKYHIEKREKKVKLNFYPI